MLKSCLNFATYDQTTGAAASKHLKMLEGCHEGLRLVPLHTSAGFNAGEMQDLLARLEEHRAEKAAEYFSFPLAVSGS